MASVLAVTPTLTPAHREGPEHARIIRAFRWKLEGGEACLCRIPAFLDVGTLTVEEVRRAVGKKSG